MLVRCTNSLWTRYLCYSRDGRTLVVEVNNGYAMGNYGLSPLNSINFHKARWKEMVKPYFEKNDIFTMPENENISF